MAEVALRLPFSIDPYGRVSSTTDQNKIWADKVRSVIGTGIKERVMRPDFGTEVRDAVFESEDESANQVKNEVTKAFNSQLRPLTLKEVQSNFDEFTGILKVDVIYLLPNEEEVSTSVGVIAVQGNLPIYEEKL